MVHNHWLVGFGSQEVTSVSYGWSLWHGGCCQDRSSHPGGDCAYGSGAWAWSGPHGTVSGIRWDDARYDCKDCPERRQSRCVPALDCEPERRDHGKWFGPVDGQQPNAYSGGGRGAVPRSVIRTEAPPVGDPERAPYLQMQTETRSLLGLLIWVTVAYRGNGDAPCGGW